MDFATYQMPFVIAGFQQVTQNLLGLLLFVDVAGHMHVPIIRPIRPAGDSR